MSIKYKQFSYPLSMDTDGYRGERSVSVKKGKSIQKGDACNSFVVSLSNHIGTHVDCPRHFYDKGKGICDYNIKDFIFSNPIILDCPKRKNQLITEDDIKKNARRLKNRDAVLFKTGFCRFRGTAIYTSQNPGIAPQAAEYIRRHCGTIRCVGIDTISVSPCFDRKMGRLTHSIFLGRGFRSEPVLLIEDMNLNGQIHVLKKLYVMPLFVENIDSAPCTVVGVVAS